MSTETAAKPKDNSGKIMLIAIGVFIVVLLVGLSSGGSGKVESYQLDPEIIASAIGNSDDLVLHKAAFMKASTQLISTRACTQADFIEHGGWTRSTRPETLGSYFVFCGSQHPKTRHRLNPTTGQLTAEPMGRQ